MKKKSLGLVFCLFMVSGTLFNSNVNSMFINNDISTSLENVYEYENWWWTTTDVVSTESTDNSASPQCATDSAGNIHIVWSDRTDYLGSNVDYDIFYKVWDSSSNSWSLTEVVSTETTNSGTHPSFAIDSEDTLHVIWQDYTVYLGAGVDQDIFYKFKSSGGSWSISEVISVESTTTSAKPALAIDSEDTLHVVWEDYTDTLGAGSDFDIFYKSKPSGGSWSTLEIASTESTGASLYADSFLDTAGNFHITWRDYTDYLGSGSDDDIFYKRKDALSGLWSVTEVVSDVSTLNVYNPTIVVDSFGQVHVVWSDNTAYQEVPAGQSLFYRMRDEQSNTWGIISVLTVDMLDGSNYPNLALDSKDTLHLVWSDGTEILGSYIDYDLFYKYFDSTSNTWSAPQLVSSGSTKDDYSNAFAIDPSDNLHVIWYDTTNYLGCGSDYDVFHTKFVGPPDAPQFLTATPNYSTTGSISLNWSDVGRTDSYYLYRETTYMTSSSGLTPILKTNESNYIDTIDNVGTYFYAVIAENEFGNSSLSPVEDVQVDSTKQLLSFMSNEVLIAIGALLATQIIFFIIAISIRKTSGKTSSKTGKKKK